MSILKALVGGIFLGIFWTTAYAVPANDNFANRTVCTGLNFAVSGNNSGATTEGGEDIGSGNIYYFDSVWYEWTAPAHGVLFVSGNTSISPFLMNASCYRGTAVDALTAVTTGPDGGIAVAPG